MSDIAFLQRGIGAVLARTRDQHLGRRVTERASLKLWVERDAYHDWFRVLLLRDANIVRDLSMEGVADGSQVATVFGVQVVACDDYELRNPDAAAHLTFTEPEYAAGVLTRSLDTWEFPALTPRHLFSPLQRRGGQYGYSIGRTVEDRRIGPFPRQADDPVRARSISWVEADEALIEERQPLYHSSRPASASSGRMMRAVGAETRIPTSKLKRTWGRE